jgi:DNA polymerase-3 subunit epsilon
LLRRLIEKFQLNESFCFIEKNAGAISITESEQTYNLKVKNAIRSLQQELPTFLVFDTHFDGATGILMEKGKFVGMLAANSNLKTASLEKIKKQVTLYPDNDYIRGLIYQFIEKHPDKKIKIFS